MGVSVETVGDLLIKGGTSLAFILITLHLVKVTLPAFGKGAAAFGQEVVGLIDRMDARHDARLDALAATWVAMAGSEREQCRHLHELEMAAIDKHATESRAHHKETRHDVRNLGNAQELLVGLLDKDGRLPGGERK